MRPEPHQHICYCSVCGHNQHEERPERPSLIHTHRSNSSSSSLSLRRRSSHAGASSESGKVGLWECRAGEKMPAKCFSSFFERVAQEWEKVNSERTKAQPAQPSKNEELPSKLGMMKYLGKWHFGNSEELGKAA
eukprot:1158006-Pelagomonas_calceolata.AAC.19